MYTIVEEARAVAAQAAYEAWRDSIDAEENALRVVRRVVREQPVVAVRCRAARRRAALAHERQCDAWAFFYDLFRTAHPEA